MRALGVAVLLVFCAGCTTVTLSQRNGCWVRNTKKSFGRTLEELGPCVRPPPTWSNDRLTRLVQECAVQADYRWTSRAMEAWSRRVPAPAQPPQEELLRTCMAEARVGLDAETQQLKATLASSQGERDELRRQLATDHAALRTSHDRIAQFLGEAAQKPAGTATATATATGTGDGKATNDSGATLAAEARTPITAAPVAVAPAPLAAPVAPPVTTPVVAEAAPEKPAAPVRTRPAARARRALVEAAARGCPVPAPAAPAPATPPSAPAAPVAE